MRVSSNNMQALEARCRSQERTPLLSEFETHSQGSKKSQTEVSYEQSNSSSSDEENDDGFHESVWKVIPSLWCGAFLSALDSTIIASTYATIGSEFSSSDQASWIATSYLLSSTALQPLYGGLSDTFGRKAALTFANAFFLVGSFGCSISSTFSELIIARIIAGIGGAGLGTLSSIVVSDLVPLSKRSTYNGFANLVYGVGQVVGAPLGGYFADTIGWRWSFLVQCPITLVSMFAIIFLVTLPKPHKKSHISDLDIVGSTSLIAAVTILMLVLQSAGIEYAWGSPHVYLPLIISIGLFALFFRTEATVKNPIVLLEVITSRNPLMCGLTNLFGYMTAMSVTFNVPLFLQIVRHETAKKAGSRLIAQIVGMCTGSMTAGFVIQATQKYYWVAISGVLFELLGCSLIASFNTDTESWQYLAYLFPAGLGHGLILSATLIALISAVKKSHQAKATSMSYLFRSFGSTFGVSVTASINTYYLQKKLPAALSEFPDGTEIAHKIVTSVKYIDKLPLEIASVARTIYNNVLHISFYVTVLLEIISLGFCIFIKEYPMNRDR